MKSKKFLAILLTATMLLSTALVGCGGSSDGKKPAEGGKKGQSITLISSDAKTLDTSKSTDQMSFNAINASMEGLTRYNNDKPEKAIAESWEQSKDGLKWTFKLRDAKWSDGKKVTAKDFEYAWKRILNPKTKAQYASFMFVLKNGEKFYEGKAKEEEVGVKAIDDKTLEVTLENPTPYFLQLTAFPLLSPLRQDIVEAAGDKYGTDPSKMVFDGPFVLEKWEKGSKITFNKNEKYWDKDTVKLDKGTFQVAEEMPTRYQMFTSKQIDGTAITGEYVQKMKDEAKAGKYDYVESTDPTSFYMIMNQNGEKANKLLTNSKIRLALSLAIDRESYVNKVYQRGFASNGLIPTGMVAGEKVYRDVVPEPLKSVANKDPKALFIEGLKELNLDPNPSKYTLRYLPQGSATSDRAYAEYFQNQWQSKIGVNIKVDSAADFSDYLKKTEEGNFEIAMSGWGADYNDPMAFIELFTTGNGNNNGKFSNAEYDKIVKDIKKEPDMNKRIELYKRAEQILVSEQAGIAPVFYKDKRFFTQKYVKGLQFPSFGGLYELKWTSIEGK
ncbi:Dipeptide-binding protein DppE precursor [Clostridium liquoris]|uniref:Dipeptide-binding protein DppE n=1 Tax=Clostridium liquoris TaxID=1289519 RepID=A0A2T0B009_9CLOT|nr:peptide ABC transporter substrate-binding protein [Clostridium liquoris]PRR76852.1 Dipeptide-binding protein DppE precursor [Clostridium liquoris]